MYVTCNFVCNNVCSLVCNYVCNYAYVHQGICVYVGIPICMVYMHCVYALCTCIVCMHCVYACVCRMLSERRKAQVHSGPGEQVRPRQVRRYGCMQDACVCHATHLVTCICTCVWLPECSEQVIGPLVEDKSDVAWVAWLKHVEFYKLAHAHEISVVDVLTLDNLIFEAQEAFRLVRKK